MTPSVVFDGVWKKFQRGERQDSLRDLLPLALKRLTGRRDATALTQEEFWALADVSFDVRPGEVLGIMGPNGAGKSTALKLLSKILRPTRGTCAIRGRVGALIEIAAGFHPDLTGRENVYLQGAILGMKRRAIDRRLDDIVDFAGVSDFLDTPVKRYSSGMHARLGFAIAAHLDPEVLLIDEVLAVGDFTFQQRCHERLAAFRRAGVAIVFVSHNVQAVAALCDRGLLLRPQRPALLSDVATITRAYMNQGAASGGDPRINVSSVELTPADRSLPLSHAIAPGTQLRLTLELEARADLPRCGIGLQVTRSDGHVMFIGASNIDGRGDANLRHGTRCRARITFRANLLRGAYSVAAILVDSDRRWPQILLPGVASFVVSETTRVGGCAELEPSYELAVPVCPDASIEPSWNRTATDRAAS